VRIGARTVIREHVTISRATRAGAATEVGSDCFLMAACHVAHDCRIGDRVVIANAVLLAGHVQIGARAFLGGGARISRDIAPFSLATERNAVIGLNIVGLRRRGLTREVVEEIKRAFRAVNTPVGNLREIAASTLERGTFTSVEARSFLDFFQGGRRGFARARARRAADEANDDE
jgi:UDP-N-acetylglucosamine acyltransferase